MSARAGFEVAFEILGANPLHPKYPLLPGDLLVEEPGGTFMKEAPGITVGGFVLTDEQRRYLRSVEFVNNGLNYAVTKEFR